MEPDGLVLRNARPEKGSFDARSGRPIRPPPEKNEQLGRII